MIPRAARFGAAGLLALLTGGCSLFLPEAVVPVHTLHYQNAESPDTLVILLPGRGGSAQGYADHGFVRQLRQCERPLSIVAADAHLGYYINESLALRLTEDIIDPARRQGIEHVWFVGISLGGLGSLIHLNDYPGTAEGAVLIAPYLGDDEVLSRLPGDPTNIEQPRSAADEDILGIWYGTAGLLDSPDPPELFLAAGTEDRFAPAHRRFARFLDDDHVLFAAGGHKWTTWEPLWAQMLPDLPFCNASPRETPEER